ADGAENGAGDGDVEIRVTRDDDGVIAAQLEDGSSEPFGYGGTDGFSHAGGAGSRDERDAGIFRQPFACFATAINEPGHSFGDAVGPKDTFDDVLAGERAKRRFLGRFPHAGIAADPGDHAVPAPYRYRKIEGRNDAHDAQRVPLFVHPVGRAFAVHGEAIELPGEAHGKIADIDHFLDLAIAFL